MAVSFIVVGQKDKDCYVVQDVREGNGGRACASLYTLTQLIQSGYLVGGCDQKKVAAGKNLSAKDVKVLTLQGTTAVRIPNFPELENTKRSCSTFIKGIKRSKHDIQKAKATGEKRSQAIQQRKESEDNADTAMLGFYKDMVEGVSRWTLQRISRVYCYHNQMYGANRVTDLEWLYDKNGKELPIVYSRSKDRTCRLSSIKNWWETEIVAKMGLTEKGYIQSSVMPKKPNTPKSIIEYVLKTTKKPIQYTYGLAYRNPTTNHVPISKEDALKILHGGHFLDVDEYDDYIHLNAYSDNDMW